MLRGPNGSGKTKALEVLFPFVLDGRIEPRRLNPFASEDRTMKSNLLYRGQEVAHAYVWMEFCRPARTASRRVRHDRHRAARTPARRPGDPLALRRRRPGRRGLLPARRRRPAAQPARSDQRARRRHGPRWTAEEYRRAVDARLFGLGPARYEQLLDLVLTLRKPQLAKDLNPVELSRTLQRGLRPLDDELIVEAAGSFDDMEAVARTLEGLVAADEATASFLSVYSTYLRTHARAAADALAARRVDADQRRVDARPRRSRPRVTAERMLGDAAERLAGAEGEPGRLRSHLDGLKASAAYRSHEQLEDLRRHVHDLASASSSSPGHRGQGNRPLWMRERASSPTAEKGSDDAARAVHRMLATQLSAEAEAAGIAWTADDAAPEGFAARIKGRTVARRDDVRVVREQLTRLAQAERDHDRADAGGRDRSGGDGRGRAGRAGRRVHASPASASRCATPWSPGLPPTRRFWPSWRRRTSRARPRGRRRTHRRACEPRRCGRFSRSTRRTGLARVRNEVARLGATRAATVDRRDALAAERDRIAAEQDDAPTASAARPADRDRTSRAHHCGDSSTSPQASSATEAAAVEAALEAAGLLDAWIHPEPTQTSAALRDLEQDGYLVALPQPAPADRAYPR